MRSEILSAINDELAYSSRHIDYKVDHCSRVGKLWSITVDLSADSAKGLDESYEGAVAWWPAEPRNGAADVLSVIAESQQINLRFATTTPPQKGELIRLYPPRYLEALRDVWTSVVNAERSVEWLDDMQRESRYHRNSVPPMGEFSAVLRRNQARAFDLMGWKFGFLWGPPGTGKTFTLGAMLAQHLVTFPKDKILLLSTTNTATDQALIAVDKALDSRSTRQRPSQLMRRRCQRVGQHFVASAYDGREHLLPVQNEQLIRQLALVESERPDKANVQQYADWKEREEWLRNEIRRQSDDVLDHAALAAMTTTSAAFRFDQLLERAPFDLIVFDEASQVSMAHALALAPLGKRVVFAGDPQQLAPIVQSKQRITAKWLGRSMFANMSPQSDSTCFLDEQSRMAEPICELVTNCFYDRQLVVAESVKGDQQWQAERRLTRVPELGDEAVAIDTVESAGTWSQKYKGPIRYESAKRISEIVALIAGAVNKREILVLTPFRAQRTLIRSFLERAGYKRVQVSTVHRAQGSERHTVIFDPADGDNKFLQTEDARRLVNVALSRAMARLVILLSAADRQNPLFEQIATVIERRDEATSAIGSDSLLKHFPEFPFDAIGQTIQLNQGAGEILDVMQGGAKFRFRDFSSGEVKTFATRVVLASLMSQQPPTSRKPYLGRDQSTPNPVRHESESEPRMASPPPVPQIAGSKNEILVKSMDTEFWFSLANWAKRNGHLTAWDRKFCFSQGSRAKKGDLPSEKQAAQCEKIIVEAERLGFEAKQRF